MRRPIQLPPMSLRRAMVALVLLALVAACDTAIQPTYTTPDASAPGGLSTPAPAPTVGAQPGGGNGGVQVLATLGSNTQSNPGGGVPEQADKPAPPPNSYKGCPAGGDGRAKEMNARKNR